MLAEVLVRSERGCVPSLGTASAGSSSKTRDTRGGDLQSTGAVWSTIWSTVTRTAPELLHEAQLGSQAPLDHRQAYAPPTADPMSPCRLLRWWVWGEEANALSSGKALTFLQLKHPRCSKDRQSGL